MATTMEPQRQPARPRSKSGFSITSDRSETSKRSGKRESHDEKRKLGLSDTTKANPNAAMNELQPSMIPCPTLDCFVNCNSNMYTVQQQLEKATIGSLREGQYVDIHGNPIRKSIHERCEHEHC